MKSNGTRVGRTIAQEWERQESESERLANRKKVKTKKIIKVLSVFLLFSTIAVASAIIITQVIENHHKVEQEKSIVSPTIPIIDEAKIGVSSRVKDYVVSLEEDLQTIGLKPNRAVVPVGKSRELDVFLDGYDYYFKLNIDRKTSIAAEDMKRMISYLTERDIHPEYVDIRVKGKAYYK